MSAIDDFTLEANNLQFSFSGKCSILEEIREIEKVDFEVSLKNNGSILGSIALTLVDDKSSDTVVGINTVIGINTCKKFGNSLCDCGYCNTEG